MPREFSVIIVPHDNRTTWNFRIAYRWLYALIAFVILGTLVGLTVMISYARVARMAHNSVVVNRENAQLRGKLAEVDSLRIELLELRALGLQMKHMLGVPLSAADSALVASLSPVARTPAIPHDEEAGGVSSIEQKRMLEAMPTVWPVKGYVTKEFKVTGGEKNPAYHPGMDIAAERETPVLVVADGIVEMSGFDETYGWMVEVDHGYGLRSVYGHNSRNLVQTGDRVTRGTTIAFVGSTGKSTAPHLHFEVRENGVPVDPRKYLLN
ncbi:MAG TPA: M23 family metallopeptidase [Candidatus Krumholzibacteria bacterium]